MLNFKEMFSGPVLSTGPAMASAFDIIEASTTQAFIDQYSAAKSKTEKAYAVLPGGQAVINVNGMLIHKLGIDQGFLGLQGYDGIERQIIQAENDPKVTEIVLDIHSGGGTVAGVVECARVVAGSSKPTVALVNELAASAAYWLACSADKVYAVSGSQVGSIGVIYVHENLSGYYSNIGVDHTVYKAGEMKDKRSQFRKPSAKETEEIQADIDKIYDLFSNWVSSNRSIDQQSVKDTEARVYYADDALKLGLIDRVGNKDDFLNTRVARGGGELVHSKGDF